MARHKEKDDEAGGEGLGKLLTRKRLWRDSTGAIVSKKRPEHEKERKPRLKNAASSATITSQAIRANAMPSLSPQSDLPLSPRSLDPRPVSTGSEVIDPLLLPRSSPDTRQVPVVHMVNSWTLPTGNPPSRDNEQDSLEFLCNGSWGQDPPCAEIRPESPYSGTLDNSE